MRAHADDLVAVLDHLGLDRAVLAGHSMGAYVATTAATVAPRRAGRTSCSSTAASPLPLPAGVDPDDMLAGVLGPALARLEMTFADRDAYHDFWRAHPALAEPGRVERDTEAWLDHDLVGTEPELRSSASLEAVRFDGTELLVDHEVRHAVQRPHPTGRAAARAARPAQPGAAAAPRRADRPAPSPLADPPRDARRQHQPLLDPPRAPRRQGRRQPPQRRLLTRATGILSRVSDDLDWRFRRAVARVEPVVEEVVAEHAVSYVGRPVRRRDIPPPHPLPGIAWSIDGELVVEFVYRASQPDQLLVHDIALLDVLRKRLRTRHVEVAHVTTTWDG